MSRASYPAEDPAPRRALLRLAETPEPALDYLVMLNASLPNGSEVEVRYVPDRQIVEAASLPDYLAALPGDRPEDIAATLLGDLSNEALPRWLRVTVTASGPVAHRVVMEERRPRWDNPALLGRMAPL